MEFQTRPGQQHAAAPARPAQAGGKKSRGKLFRAASVVMLVCVTLLAAALIVLIATSDKNKEADHLDKSKFQAVFLNGGQVYFGKIRDLNSKFLTVDNIYYLRVNQEVQPDTSDQQSQQSISLAKLGCELHGPQDQMVINRDQVTFWENLKDDGQVAKAIAEFVKQNPEGQKCAEPQAQQ